MDPVSQGTVGAAFAQSSSANKTNIVKIGFIGFLAISSGFRYINKIRVILFYFLNIIDSSPIHFFLFPLAL